MICLASSTKTGLQKPNCSMLLAIWRICFFECVRALLGCGRSSRTRVYSIFIAIPYPHRQKATSADAEAVLHCGLYEKDQGAYDECRGFLTDFRCAGWRLMNERAACLIWRSRPPYRSGSDPIAAE